MSCGSPHDTDCAEVLDRLQEYLDSELPGVTVDKIRVHLEECGPCLAEADIEREIKALVARCGKEPAPEGLRRRIAGIILRARAGVD